MQLNEISHCASEEQSHELLRHIGRGLQATFDGCLSEPLPTQLDELVGLIRLRTDEIKQSAGETREA